MSKERQQDELDAFVRSKLAGREFPLDPAHWEAASTLIAQQSGGSSPTKDAYVYWLDLGLLLLLLISFMGIPLARNLTPRIGIAASPDQIHSLTSIAEPQPNDHSLADQINSATTAQNPASPKKTFHPIQNTSSVPGPKTQGGVDLPDQQHKRGQFQTRSVSGYRISGIDPRRTDDPGLYANANRLRYPGESRAARRNSLGLIGGVQASRALGSGENASTSPGQDLLLGLRVSLGLSRGWYLYTGLIAQSRSGLNADKVFENQEFGFGFQGKRTTISPQTAYYLEMPLHIQYRIAPRHMIQAGIDMEYLLAVKSRVTVEDQASLQPGSTRSYDDFGYSQGFEPLQLNLNVGYRYLLVPRLHLGLDARYGLTDLTDDDYFQNTSFDRNLQLRLLLEFDLFSF